LICSAVLAVLAPEAAAGVVCAAAVVAGAQKTKHTPRKIRRDSRKYFNKPLSNKILALNP
jgi:hypothetical protein